MAGNHQVQYTGTNLDTQLAKADHDNRTALDAVEGVNTGDQDLSGKEDVGVAAGLVGTHESTYDHTVIADIDPLLAKLQIDDGQLVDFNDPTIDADYGDAGRYPADDLSLIVGLAPNKFYAAAPTLGVLQNGQTVKQGMVAIDAKLKTFGNAEDFALRNGDFTENFLVASPRAGIPGERDATPRTYVDGAVGGVAANVEAVAHAIVTENALHILEANPWFFKQDDILAHRFVTTPVFAFTELNSKQGLIIGTSLYIDYVYIRELTEIDGGVSQYVMAGGFLYAVTDKLYFCDVYNTGLEVGTFAQVPGSATDASMAYLSANVSYVVRYALGGTTFEYVSSGVLDGSGTLPVELGNIVHMLRVSNGASYPLLLISDTSTTDVYASGDDFATYSTLTPPDGGFNGSVVRLIGNLRDIYGYAFMVHTDGGHSYILDVFTSSAWVDINNGAVLDPNYPAFVFKLDTGEYLFFHTRSGESGACLQILTDSSTRVVYKTFASFMTYDPFMGNFVISFDDPAVYGGRLVTTGHFKTV